MRRQIRTLCCRATSTTSHDHWRNSESIVRGWRIDPNQKSCQRKPSLQTSPAVQICGRLTVLPTNTSYSEVTAWYFQSVLDQMPLHSPMRTIQWWRNINNVSVQNYGGLRWIPILKKISSLVTLAKRTSRPERPEPVCPTNLPKEPWIHPTIDVCGPFPTGQSVVVLTDC